MYDAAWLVPCVTIQTIHVTISGDGLWEATNDITDCTFLSFPIIPHLADTFSEYRVHMEGR